MRCTYVCAQPRVDVRLKTCSLLMMFISSPLVWYSFCGNLRLFMSGIEPVMLHKKMYTKYDVSVIYYWPHLVITYWIRSWFESVYKIKKSGFILLCKHSTKSSVAQEKRLVTLLMTGFLRARHRSEVAAFMPSYRGWRTQLFFFLGRNQFYSNKEDAMDDAWSVPQGGGTVPSGRYKLIGEWA